jgi:drug/metabolite transporter (DMT)-like permease
VGERQERIGLGCAALCAVNGAFVPAFAKLTTNGAPPTCVATITTLFAGGCAALVLALRGELRLLARRGVALPLLAVGALGTGLAFVLFFSGAQRSTAIETVLCLQIEPVYSLVAAWAVLNHRPTRRRLMAIGVLLVGIACAVGGQAVAPSSGVWLLLATPLCWQASHLLVVRRLQGVPPPVVTGARYVQGGVLLALYWLASGGLADAPPAPLLLRQLPLLAVQGVVLTYLGTLLWYQAIARLDLARTTAIVVPAIPLLSLGASFALLGEVPSVAQGVGLLLTAVGIFGFVSAPHAVPRPRIPALGAPLVAPGAELEDRRGAAQLTPRRAPTSQRRSTTVAPAGRTRD